MDGINKRYVSTSKCAMKALNKKKETCPYVHL